MLLLDRNQYGRVGPLFAGFGVHLPIIYSVLEGQYDGNVYINDDADMQWALLQTPFLQSFLCGVPTDGCRDELERLLFHCMVEEQGEKEIVLFAASPLWRDILDDVFRLRQGVTDVRKLFAFSPPNYARLVRPTVPPHLDLRVVREKAIAEAHRPTWVAELREKDEVLSYCRAFMEGKGYVEIDIGTSEAHRGKGYATITAMALIDQLREEGLTPCWSTWPRRVESQNLAVKLGFAPLPDDIAWIWLEGMGH